MTSRQIQNGWILRLDRGEELVGSLQAFCEDQSITAGWIQGLGGTTQATLGYYNLNRQKYIFRAVKDARELVSLHGNISKIGDTVALHLHGVVTDSNNKPRGGHIRELRVGGTCELKIEVFENEIQRKIDPELGLPLMQL